MRIRKARGDMRSVAFAPDGKRVVYGVLEGKAQVWDFEEGRELPLLEGHSGWVWNVAFAPDGRTVASASFDSTALIWDVSKTASEKPRKALADGELDRLWGTLAGSDAKEAYGALWTLNADPDGSVSFLKRHVQAVPAAGGRLAQWIEDLDSDEFATREKASTNLELQGEAAKEALRKALDARPSLEKRSRIVSLLSKLDPSQAPRRLQALRAVEVLEYIATPQAREVLKMLGKGAPEARLTLEANASLERLGNRPVSRP